MSRTEIELLSYPAGVYLEGQTKSSNVWHGLSRDKSPNRPTQSERSIGQTLGTSPTQIDEHPPQKWNESKNMVARVFTSFWCMIVLGSNDAQIGAILPYLQSYYQLSYIITSLIFICPAIGYILAGFTVNRIHVKFGQRGIAITAPVCKILGYTIVSQHPPYPSILVALIIVAYGNGLEDSALNAFIGSLANANEVLGFLHGCFGLGGVIAPLIATAMITKANLGWWTFTYVLLGAAVIEMIIFPLSFWHATGKVYRDSHAKEANSGSTTLATIRNRIVWTCAIFLLIYVGIEVSLGGWVVTFMLQIRGTTEFDAGVSATAFWLGITIGRVVLGFVTGRIGEKLAIMIYLGCAVGLHLIFYLVPSMYASFVAVSFEGFFLGPLFPAAIVAMTKLLPSHLQVSGVGFAAAVGASGACLLPFAVGAIAQSKGVQVLMPIVLAFLAVDAAVWWLLPSGKKWKRGKAD